MTRFGHEQSWIGRFLARPYLPALLFAIIGLTVFALTMDLRLSPAMVYPVCQDYRSYRDGRRDNTLDVEGGMADDFLAIFKRRVPSNIVPDPTNPRRLYVRWGEAPDRRELHKQTQLTVRELIAHRHGREASMAVLMGRARPPAPEFHEFDAYATCAAIRKMALQGGEWAESGPPLAYLSK